MTTPTLTPTAETTDAVAEQSPLTAYEKAQLWLLGALREQYEDERGMSTIEYALGCVAAAALGALLYTVVTSDSVESALTSIFERALKQK